MHTSNLCPTGMPSLQNAWKLFGQLESHLCKMCGNYLVNRNAIFAKCVEITWCGHYLAWKLFGGLLLLHLVEYGFLFKPSLDNKIKPGLPVRVIIFIQAITAVVVKNGIDSNHHRRRKIKSGLLVTVIHFCGGMDVKPHVQSTWGVLSHSSDHCRTEANSRSSDSSHVYIVLCKKLRHLSQSFATFVLYERSQFQNDPLAWREKILWKCIPQNICSWLVCSL